jgi:hypothetical protein
MNWSMCSTFSFYVKLTSADREPGYVYAIRCGMVGGQEVTQYLYCLKGQAPKWVEAVLMVY